jgi:hypothetical protein
MGGNCNNCEEAGKPCTKHTEPVADCVPELLTAEPDKPPNKKKSTGKKKSEKRKATKSPETSPKAKPQAKSRCATQRSREEDLVFDLDEANEHVFGMSLPYLRYPWFFQDIIPATIWLTLT